MRLLATIIMTAITMQVMQLAAPTPIVQNAALHDGQDVRVEEVKLFGRMRGNSNQCNNNQQQPIFQKPVEVLPSIKNTGNNNGGQGGASGTSNVTINNVIEQVNAQNQALQQQIDGLKDKINQGGLNGKDGEPGPAGPAGPQGLAGAAGERGPAGVAGKDGANGKDGVTPTDAQLNVLIAAYFNAHKDEFKGRDGNNGSDGEDAKWNLAEFNQFFDEDGDGIYEKLPPFYFRVIDPRGLWTTDTLPIHLGERLSLRLSPVTDGPGVQGGITPTRDMPPPEVKQNDTGRQGQGNGGGAS